MLKYWNQLQRKMKRNKKSLLFLLIIVSVGFLAGAFFIAMIGKTDQEMIGSYLDNYVQAFQTQKMNYGQVFLNALLSHLLALSAIFLLGISVLGVPFSLCITFGKGFLLGFSVTSIFYHYKLKGILMVLAYLFPQQIIYMLVLLFASIYAVRMSFAVGHAVLHKETINFKDRIGQYSKVFFICSIAILISALLETCLTPIFMSGAIGFLK